MAAVPSQKHVHLCDCGGRNMKRVSRLTTGERMTSNELSREILHFRRINFHQRQFSQNSITSSNCIVSSNSTLADDIT